MAPPRTPRHVLFVFVDGVGLGPAGPHNPLARLPLPAFHRLAGGHPWTDAVPAVDRAGHVFRPIDATLGLPGLPQSGTGQATLFTGTNCAAVVGRHFGPFPHSATRPVLAERNLLRRVRTRFPDEPEPAAFANAYPPRFFEMARRRDRWTVTTRCCLDAGVRLRSTDDVCRGEAVTAEITGAAWREHLGLDVPLLTEREAAGRLLALARRHRLTLFEYYLTDKAGHGRLDDADGVVRSLDRLFDGLLDGLDPQRELLLITSDHGNVEDLGVKTHTRHPVPMVALGAGADRFGAVPDLTGVTPALMDALSRRARR